MKSGIAQLSFRLLLLIFLLLPSLVKTETPSQYQIQLNKDFISWVWLGNLRFQTALGNFSSFYLNNRFTSNLYWETNQQNKWRDENVLEAGWEVPLHPGWSTRTILSSHVFSDENTVVKFSKHLIAQSVTYRPASFLELSPATGLAMEEIFAHRDFGWYAKMGLKSSRWDMGGYLNYTNAESSIRFFPGRKNQEHTIFTGWSKKFSEQASDSIRLGYQFSENRYYLQSTDALEQVIINARFLNNQLSYQTSRQSRMVISTEFRNRDIDQSNPFLNNRRKEFFVGNRTDFQIAWGALQTQWGLVFSQNTNNNPGLQTDIDALQTTLLSSFRWIASPSNRFFGRFSYTKYEYNTPDTLINNDDRDEQRFIIDGGYTHRFSPYFSFSLQAQVFLYHQIYIHPSRSANNNWNRIFQLTGSFTHQPSRQITHRSQMKILANYTAFDFDEIFPEVRSYLYRKLIYVDSLSVQISRNLSLNTIYQMEKEDNGTFIKQLFAQQVLKEIRSHYINLNLHRKNVLGFQLTTGFTLYLRDEWTFLPQKRRIRRYRSFAPRLTLSYPANKNLVFRATYAPNKTTDLGGIRQYSSTGNVLLQYAF